MITYQYYKAKCEDSPACFKNLLLKLQTSTGLILENKNANKIVNGSLSVWHLDSSHLLRIETCEKNEVGEHAIFKKPTNESKKKLKEVLKKLPRATSKLHLELLEKCKRADQTP